VSAADTVLTPAVAYNLHGTWRPDAVFGKVNTEAQPELAAGFGISSIPTLVIIRDKVVLYAQPGALPEQALDQLITKAREIDMDQVRASLATAADSPGA
jgi:thioredoxin 1